MLIAALLLGTTGCEFLRGIANAFVGEQNIRDAEAMVDVARPPDYTESVSAVKYEVESALEAQGVNIHSTENVHAGVKLEGKHAQSGTNVVALIRLATDGDVTGTMVSLTTVDPDNPRLRDAINERLAVRLTPVVLPGSSSASQPR